MEKVGHIYIYGDIVNFQGEGNSEWGCVALKDVVAAMQANPEADSFLVHINSRGGDVSEGFAIHDAILASGKKITTIVEGLCASIATVIALAGSNRQITKNSELMIHNPWGFAGGDAEELQKYTDQVKAYEEKLLNFYVEKTGGDSATIKSMMDAETFIDSAKALELKFVTEIVEQVKAFAKITAAVSKKENKMFDQLKEKAKNLIADIKASLKDAGIKALLTLTATDGQKIEIETDETEPKVGDICNIDGKPAPDASYAMPDGKTIITASGKISEIQAPTQTSSDALAEKDEEILALKNKITEMETAANDSKNSINELQTQFDEIKNLSSKFLPKERKAPTAQSTTLEEAKTAEQFKQEADERKNAYKKK